MVFLLNQYRTYFARGPGVWHGSPIQVITPDVCSRYFRRKKTAGERDT